MNPHIVFRDLAKIILVSISVILILILFLVKNVTQNAKDAQSTMNEGETTVPGRMQISLLWDDDVDVDLDLWVLPPNYKKPIGFSNPGNEIVNLLRDDMGSILDPTNRNFENIYARELYPGEWIINVHVFRKPIQKPVKGILEILIMDKNRKIAKKFVVHDTFYMMGAEKTVARFRLDNNGNYIEGSFNREPIGILERLRINRG